MRISTTHMHGQNINDPYESFEVLYDKYAPKAFGFITKYTHTKEEAEEFLKHVFLKAWEDDIKIVDEHSEKKILNILLSICKPLYKNKASKAY